MKAGRHKRSISTAAANHSDLAWAVRELETQLRRVAWSSDWVDYQLGRRKSSDLTNRLFREADNAAARRRRIMKKEKAA